MPARRPALSVSDLAMIPVCKRRISLPAGASLGGDFPLGRRSPPIKDDFQWKSRSSDSEYIPQLLNPERVCTPVRGKPVEQTRYVRHGSCPKILSLSPARLCAPPPRHSPDHKCLLDRPSEPGDRLFHDTSDGRRRLPRSESARESSPCNSRASSSGCYYIYHFDSITE